jgi:hypothetical protein
MGRKPKVSAEPLGKFDVYLADGRLLRFLCTVEAKDFAAAERMVRRRVPKEHRDNMVVKARGA